MAYRIDPDILQKVAQQVAGLQLGDGEVTARAIELLADEYPGLIDSGPGRWAATEEFSARSDSALQPA